MSDNSVGFESQLTGVVYQMSIPLTTEVLSLQGLSQSEKHVLTVLCYRADKHNEVYSSIKKLSLDCSCSHKTIERALQGLRDKKYLSYTGRLAPGSRSIPIYSINLNHGQNGGGLNLRTDNLSLTHPQNGVSRTDKMGIRIDNINKDNKKDICSFSPSLFEKQQVSYFLKKGEEIPHEYQNAYLWLVENNLV